MIEHAISLAEQVQLLKQRGLTIDDDDMAADVLSAIGFYRMNTYLFPFEHSYPDFNRRTHRYKNGANFIDAVRLYYFDAELRNMFLKYIFSIEVTFRAVLTYEGSMLYRHDPWWFVNPSYVSADFIADFDRVVYNGAFRKNPAIRRHHSMYKKDRYAPAWKTIELMTFGENIVLYNSLRDGALRQKISEKFGIRYIEVFENYMELVRILRNACAHSSSMFDFRPYKRIRKGPAGLNSEAEYMNISGCYKVVRYLLRHVSVEREKEMSEEVRVLLEKNYAYPGILDVLRTCSGFSPSSYKGRRR